MNKRFRFGRFFRRERERNMAERMQEAQQAALRRLEIRNRIKALNLESFADGLVEEHALYERPEGKNALRIMLQRLLFSFEREGKGKPKMNSAEKACFALVKSVDVIQIGLCKNPECRVPIQTAAKMYKAMAFILKNFGDSKGEKKAKRNAIELGQRIAYGPKTEGEKYCLVNALQMENTIAVGTSLAKQAAQKMPEHMQIGFEIIEEIVAKKLGR